MFSTTYQHIAYAVNEQKFRIQTDESETNMANIRLTLQYDGSRYLGWQRPEKDGYPKTIAYRLSSVLEKMTGGPVTLYAGAKTEPGVHALEQTVSFAADSLPDMKMLQQNLDHYLPMDIRILRCEAAPDRHTNTGSVPLLSTTSLQPHIQLTSVPHRISVPWRLRQDI